MYQLLGLSRGGDRVDALQGGRRLGTANRPGCAAVLTGAARPPVIESRDGRRVRRPETWSCLVQIDTCSHR